MWVVQLKGDADTGQGELQIERHQFHATVRAGVAASATGPPGAGRLWILLFSKLLFSFASKFPEDRSQLTFLPPRSSDGPSTAYPVSSSRVSQPLPHQTPLLSLAPVTLLHQPFT
jgi:hypothetical protein